MHWELNCGLLNWKAYLWYIVFAVIVWVQYSYTYIVLLQQLPDFYPKVFFTALDDVSVYWKGRFVRF